MDNNTWTAKYTNVQKTDTTIGISVSFFKDGEHFADVSFDNVDPATIKTRILGKLAELQAIDSVDISSLQGDVDLTPLSNPIIIPPTQAELDRANYFTLLEKYTQAKIDIQNGLLDANNPIFVQLVIDIKAAYKPEYSGL